MQMRVLLVTGVNEKKRKIFETEPREENGKRLTRRLKTGSP
jgi:hypothetical protein